MTDSQIRLLVKPKAGFVGNIRYFCSFNAGQGYFISFAGFKDYGGIETFGTGLQIPSRVEFIQQRPALRHWRAYVKLDNHGPWADHARGQMRKLLSREKLAIVSRAGHFVAPRKGLAALRLA